MESERDFRSLFFCLRSIRRAPARFSMFEYRSNSIRITFELHSKLFECHSDNIRIEFERNFGGGAAFLGFRVAGWGVLVRPRASERNNPKENYLAEMLRNVRIVSFNIVFVRSSNSSDVVRIFERRSK